MKHLVGLLDPNPVKTRKKKTQKQIKVYGMGYHASGEKVYCLGMLSVEYDFIFIDIH